MPVSRRSFVVAAAAAGLAACTRAAHRVTSARSQPTGTAAAPTLPPLPSGPAASLYSGPRDGKSVALTFHGSGDPNLTEQLLSQAARLRVPITVFAVGKWLEQYPDMSRRILAAGHELENHTYTHPSLATARAATVADECRRCRDVLAAQTGTGGRYFRPSGIEGHYPPVISEQAGAIGYATVVGFDVDPLDYQDPGSAAIVARVRQAVRPGSIVSLHLGHAGTVTAFPLIVADLRSRGLEPVLVRDLLA